MLDRDVTTLSSGPIYNVRPNKLDRRIQQLRWQGDAQGATNEDSDEERYQPRSKFIDGYLAEYSCAAALEGNFDISNIVVTYEYEIAIKLGEDQRENIRGLEWMLLTNLVDTIGLEDCEKSFQQQIDASGNNRALLENTSGGEDPTVIVLVSSLPRDEPLEGTGACQVLEYAEEESYCVPMSGFMLVGHTGSDEESVRDYITGVVEYEMNNAVERNLLVNHLNGVSFVPQNFGQTEDGVSEPEVSNNQIGAPILTTMISASILLVVLSALFFVFKRSRQSDENSKEVDEEYVDEESPRDSEVHGVTSPISSIRSSPRDASRIPSLTSSESTDDDSDTGIVSPQSGEISPATATTGSNTTSAGPNNPILDIPMKRSRSQKLKKRRKKKKKKKQTLLRVNSREMVSGMDVIPESDEEGSDIGSEYESDYSTDDEESNTDRTTPAGSRFSPPLSPQNEFFPSDVFTDIDYTVDNSEFEIVNSPSDENNNNGNIPATIKEESIKPIPPPWA